MSSFYTNFFLRGKNLYVRSITNGVRSQEKVPVHPTLYAMDRKNTDPNPKHRDIYGNALKSLPFDTPADARDFIAQYKDTDGFQVLGFNRYEYVKIDDLFPGIIDPNEELMSQLNIAVVDIETKIGQTFATAMNPHQEINAISLMINGGTIKTWSLYNVLNHDPDTTHVFCRDEEHLLKLFVMEWSAANIDIVSGWNSSNFDLPYIMKRIEMGLGEDYASQMSPWGLYEFYTETTKYGAETLRVKIEGISDLDLLELYRKFVLKKQESYSLDYIAKVDIKDSKTPFEGSLKDLYEGTYEVTEAPKGDDEFSILSFERYVLKNRIQAGEKLDGEYQRIDDLAKMASREKFVMYNQHDVRLVWKINQKRRLIENAIMIAYVAKVNFEDAYSTSRPWDVIIGNFLRHENIHVPCHGGGSKSEKFEGAFVKEPIIGYHEWVMAFDLTSLYPSLMRQYNISPETILDKRFPIRPDDIRLKTEVFKKALAYAEANNATLTANGTMYSKDKKGFIPLLVGDMFNRRKAAKDEQKEWEKLGESAKAILENRKAARAS